MSNKEKKKKAAIAAVLAYLNEKDENKKKNKWVLLGRKIIMDNNIKVQTKKF